MIEVLKCGSDSRFVGDKENPSTMGMVINQGHKPSFSRRGSHLRWFPNIAMNKSEVGLTCMVSREKRLDAVLCTHHKLKKKIRL